MSSNVNHPRHYNTHPSRIEAIEICRHLDFNIGNAVKYVWRHRDKGGHEDIEKALWYLDDHITEFGPSYHHPSNDIPTKLALAAETEPNPHLKAYYLSLAQGDINQAAQHLRQYHENHTPHQEHT